MKTNFILAIAAMLAVAIPAESVVAGSNGTPRTMPMARPTITRSYNQSATRTAPVRTATVRPSAAQSFNSAAGARRSITSTYNSSSFRPYRGPAARPTMQQTYSSRYPGGAAIGRNGRVIGRTIILPKGTMIDRIGSSQGRTFGRPGTSIAARAIKPSRQPSAYSVDRLQRPVLARIERVQPQFGKQGRGFQYRIITPTSVQFGSAAKGPSRATAAFGRASGGNTSPNFARQQTLRQLGYLRNVARSSIPREK